jgi:hypothetical protein
MRPRCPPGTGASRRCAGCCSHAVGTAIASTYCRTFCFHPVCHISRNLSANVRPLIATSWIGSTACSNSGASSPWPTRLDSPSQARCSSSRHVSRAEAERPPNPPLPTSIVMVSSWSADSSPVSSITLARMAGSSARPTKSAGRASKYSPGWPSGRRVSSVRLARTVGQNWERWSLQSEIAGNEPSWNPLRNASRKEWSGATRSDP